MAGISVWQLLIIALIVVLLFGTNKLRTLGSDLGASIKGFKKAVSDEDKLSGSTDSKQNNSKQNDIELDAEFKSLAEKQAAQPEEIKSQNKEQV